MPLLRDVVTAVGIDLEGHGGHSGSMDEGRAIHVGLHARICRPRRLWGRATLASYREDPLSEGRPARCAPYPGRQPPGPCNKVPTEQRARHPSVGRTTNLCLGAAQELARRTDGRGLIV